MASGYEKSPDYGGPPVTWREVAIWVAIILAVVGAVIIYRAIAA